MYMHVRVSMDAPFIAAVFHIKIICMIQRSGVSHSQTQLFSPNPPTSKL